MIVKLQREMNSYADIALEQPYFVIGIESNDYRILNDHGKPYLYPSSLFIVIDTTEPEDWITKYGEDGERYSYPSILNGVGFFEDYFDGKTKAISDFWHDMNQRLSHAA